MKEMNVTNSFAITEDGEVWQMRDRKMGFRLGLIGCLLNDAERTPTPTNLAVREWWRDHLNSEEAAEQYVPEVEPSMLACGSRRFSWYLRPFFGEVDDTEAFRNLEEPFEYA